MTESTHSDDPSQPTFTPEYGAVRSNSDEMLGHSPRPNPDTATTSQQASLAKLQLANRTLGTRNAKLVELLKASREKLNDLNEQIRALADPPSTYGILLEVNSNGTTAEVYTSNRPMRLVIAPNVEIDELQAGMNVRLGEGQQVVEACGYLTHGDMATVKEFLPATSRVVVADSMGEARVVRAAQPLQKLIVDKHVGIGDCLLVDYRCGYAFELIPKADVENLVLEEVPDVNYEDIGGLREQIELIRDSVELPFLHPELYRSYKLKPPKGVLLYGPPGCGKTLIAKAVANSLAAKVGGGDETNSYFINVKGPELLNKFVGETERQIRQIFERARSIANEGRPVIVYFDEMDAIFRTRGSGLSSDMENTVVPQLLAEIDGVEDLRNVIVIGASNREEMIDPAILRPGRLDVKIRISRPDEESARSVAKLYITPDLPLDPEFAQQFSGADDACAALIDALIDRMYRTDADNEFVELTYASGRKEVLHYRDFASGAMIANIVDRAKKHALKASLKSQLQGGLNPAHIDRAVAEEFAENDDLPNTAHPDEWARISGRSGRVVDVSVLAHRDLGHATTDPNAEGVS